jgi:aryl-alcohol dehydrogenase-like predicted oxidoreductase
METVRALERLKRQGKVRAVGVSNFAVRDLSSILKMTEIVSDQLPYSLLWRAIEHEIKPLCLKNNVGIICYSPLAQGLLAGRYKSADEVPEGLARTRLFSNKRLMARHSEPGCEDEAFEAIASIRKVADGLGKHMATVSLAWVKQRRGVTTFLVGARTPRELTQNLPAVDLKLGADVTKELDRVTSTVKRYVGRNPDPWNSENRTR